MSTKSSGILNFGRLCWEHKFSTADIWDIFCRRVTKFGTIRGLVNRQLFPNFVNFGPKVSRYRAATCIRPSVMHLFVCAVDEINELWQRISGRAVVRRGQNLIWDLDTRSPIESPLGRQNIEGVTQFMGSCFTSPGVKGVPSGAKIVKGVQICNAFVIHRLTEHDEIWHDEGHLRVTGLKGFW